MIEWCSGRKVDVLLSTGGTGFSPRDVTPEATLGLVQKLTPGISQAIMNESLKITPLAMLSRYIFIYYKQNINFIYIYISLMYENIIYVNKCK